MSKRVISSRLCIGYLRVGDHIVHTAPRTRCTAKDSGQLLCRYGVDATPSRQGAQKSQQAPPPLQYVEDRVCLPDGNDVTKTNSRVLVDESKQADIENLGDCLRALGDGQSLGDFSLTIVLYGRSKIELEQLGAEFTGVFTKADGNLFAETYNQLNAYFATVPGNYALNLRKLFLLNTNYADLSFLFTILPGEKTNAHLGTEYLAVVETDNSTPYFLNLHTRDVAHTLILGMTGSGKSYLCVFLLQNAQKYKPLTYIFDIGGSFQSLTTIFRGSYLNVGQEARDFTINPFSLPQTKENMQFLFSFFRVLIEGNERRHRLDFQEERP